MFKLGLQVLRERWRDVVDPARVRRAAWWSGGVSVLVLIGLTAVQLGTSWVGAGTVRPVAAIALLGIGAGLLLFGCFPTDAPLDPAATINGRPVRADHRMTVRHSVQPYLGRRPPKVTPDDRADVLTDVRLLQRGQIRRISRFGPAFVGLAAVGGGVVASGGVHSFAVAWTFLYVWTLPDIVHRLGTAERLRLDALSVDAPVGDPREPRNRYPNGSKVRLPGD